LLPIGCTGDTVIAADRGTTRWSTFYDDSDDYSSTCANGWIWFDSDNHQNITIDIIQGCFPGSACSGQTRLRLDSVQTSFIVIQQIKNVGFKNSSSIIVIPSYDSMGYTIVSSKGLFVRDINTNANANANTTSVKYVDASATLLLEGEGRDLTWTLKHLEVASEFFDRVTVMNGEALTFTPDQNGIDVTADWMSSDQRFGMSIDARVREKPAW
jgi:hypothetical protein